MEVETLQAAIQSLGRPYRQRSTLYELWIISCFTNLSRLK
jgi:2-iminoacetate synthase ThiH